MYPKGPHKLGTPGWEDVHAELLAAAKEFPFGKKIGRAAFSGNCGQTPNKARPRLKMAAKAHPELMFVNDVNRGCGPIARGEAVYTQRENQSQEERHYILSVRTNRRRGGSIYPA